MIPESAKEAPGRIDGVPSNLSPRTRPSGRLAMDEVPINPAPARRLPRHRPSVDQSSRLNSPGSFATLIAMRRASSFVSTLACDASGFAVSRHG